MNPGPLPPVPSPLGRHWQVFRMDLLPQASFVLVLAVAAWLWSRNLGAPLQVGTAEGIVENVVAPQPGVLAELLVCSEQRIAAGDLIAIVHRAGPASGAQAPGARAKPERVEIRAPVDGAVKSVAKRPGNPLKQNDLICRIENLRADRIVGYVDERIVGEPRIGMEVEIRSRTGDRVVARARITSVGSQEEPAAGSGRRDRLPDPGRQRVLPVIVEVPSNVHLRSGQQVYIDFKAAPPKGT